MEQTLLKDIPVEKDYPIAHLLRISDVELKDTKSGKKYLSLGLGDSTKSLKWCKKWDSSDDEYNRLRKVKVVFVTGKTDVYNDNMSIVCESIALPEDGTEDEFLKDLIPSTVYNIKNLKKEVWGYIQKMECPNLKKLAELLVVDPLVKERLGTYPAAVAHHHPYRGGLLTHIYRLMINADSIVDIINSNMYPGSHIKINKDLVMFTMLAHDLYKIVEYNEDCSYSPWGGITPHLPLGAIEASRKMDKIEDFPDNLRTAVIHCLIGHHGQWGPTTPKTPEAIVSHYLDDMFAKLDPVLEALDATDEEFSPEKVKAVNGSAWIGASSTDN